MQRSNKLNELFDFKSRGYEVGELIGQGGFGKVHACKKIGEQ